jgi:hypothetical protein
MNQGFLNKCMATTAGLLCIFSGSLQANCNSLCNLPNCLFYVGGEGLYWTVNQSDLDYAMDLSSLLGRDEVVGPGNVHFLDYDWDWGFRLWLGLHGESGWDMRGAYTHFKNKTSVSRTGSEDHNLIATLVHPGLSRCEAFSASLDNCITYNTYDILLGNEVSLCCDALKLNPFFGLRGLTLEQRLNAMYSGVDFVNNRQVPTPGQVKYNSDLRALGIHAGMDINYYLCKGFGFYGGFAGSVLAGKSDNKQRQFLLNPDGTIDETEVDIREKENLIIPGYHFRAGINWQSCFDYGSHMIFTFGYEFHQWFNTPQLRRFSDDNCPGLSSGNRGDIGFQGAVVSFTLFF